MARKPAHLEQARRKPTGRRAIWAAIRARAEGFTLLDLADATRTPRDTVRDYLAGLEAAGYVAQIGAEAPRGAGAVKPRRIFALVRDVGIEAPRVTKDGRPVTQGASREQMWRAMRMLRGDWSWRDLAIAASTEEHAVSEIDASDYCTKLALAGYLVVTETGHQARGDQSATPTRYRFVPARNTGPRPPMVQRLHAVFDPNLGKVVWQEAPHDE